jgi:hypothetical protein
MWSAARELLEQGLRDVSGRGSLADSGLEGGMDWMRGIEALHPMQTLATRGIEEWLNTGVWPAMPPAALRLAEFQMYFALDVCRNLEAAPWASAEGLERRSCIEWLLSLWHSAALPSFDHTVGDLLENAREATPEER